jgi:gamma-glutamyltranspeptidase/glutathione hydrolase
VLPGVPNEYGLVGSEANAIAGRKRPLSSMTPTVLREGGHTVTLVIGSPGGPRIISAVLQVLLRTLVYGQSLEDAILAPRLHQQWKPAWTQLEPGWDPRIRDELLSRGHDLREMGPLTSVQAIGLEPGGEPVAVSDPRRGGVGGLQGRELPIPQSPPEDETAIARLPGSR